MKNKWSVVLILGILFAVQGAGFAEKWSRAYIRSLPDSAFAVIEIGPKGEKIRRLPHHDLSGAVDRPHLQAALRLWHRTRWLNSEDARIAWEHLRRHAEEIK